LTELREARAIIEQLVALAPGAAEWKKDLAELDDEMARLGAAGTTPKN
jgi:hypothetical protein